ncbi:MAG: CHRD domain-containing protein [Bacteroidota bacterium]
MKKSLLLFCALFGMMLMSAITNAQSVIPSKWLVPAGKSWLNATSSNTRGMAYNPVTKHVLVASRETGINAVVILNAATGDSIGKLNMTGISGGTFTFVRVGVANDGRIYTSNLQTTVNDSTQRQVKIYTWADESSAPTIAFADSVRGPRMGDALTVVGAGESTYVYLSGNTTPGAVNVFKRSGDTLVLRKTIVPTGWATGVLGIGPETNGFGSFWLNTSGKAAMKFDTSGNVLDTIPTGVAATGFTTATYFEFNSRKFLGMYSGNASATNPSLVRVVDITAGGASSYVVAATTSLGNNPNSNATGDVIYSAADSSLYVFSTNNAVGKFSIPLSAPGVTFNSRVPFIPNAGENDTVYFNLLTMKSIGSAQLKYFGHRTSVSDTAGVDSAFVTLSQSNGRVYRAVVPASVNRNGRRINFRAEVTDGAGVNATIIVPGYYAGVTKLAYKGGPREVDTNGVLLFKGYGIRTQGVVTVEDSIFQVANNEIVAQDSLGGVTIFRTPSGGPLFDVKRGNAYIITGTTDNPIGGGSKFQFNDPGIDFTDLGPAPPIKPRLVTIKELLNNGELFENSLVEIRNVTKTASSPAWPAAGTSVNMIFKDQSGDSTTMRIDSDTNIDGIPEPVYPITIVGPAGQFDNSSPFTSGYQWLPRDTNDIRLFKPRPFIPPFAFAPANITFGALLDTVQAGNGGRKGVGTAAFVLSEDRMELMYQVTVAGLSGTISNAHFHNAAAGVSGGVVKDIKFNGSTAYGFWRATDANQPLSPAMLTELFAGKLYVNVHTTTFGGGEIRGQVYPSNGIAFASVLDSVQAKTSSHANGTAAVFLSPDRSTVKYSVTIEGLEGTLSAAHFHNAAPDSNGGVVKDITIVNGTAMGEWKKTDGTQPLTDQLIAELMRGRLYVNVHSSQNPGGEIRGQVRLVGGYGFAAMLDSALAGTNKPGRGTAVMLFHAGEKEAIHYRITVAGLSGEITGAHIHYGAKGVNGPVLKPLNFFGNTASGIWSTLDSTNKLNDSLVTALVRGRLYVNIHTAAHPGGEIRGQIELVTGFGIAVGLDNLQAKTNSGGKGTGWVVVSPGQDEVKYNFTVNGLTGAVTNSHFHNAQRGINGGVVKNIAFANGNSSGSWKATDATQPLTGALLDSLFNGGLYVNIHTAANPGGEIRGQLEPGQGTLTAVKRVSEVIPAEFSLEQNYPNPFNPSTVIQFALPNDAKVSLKIYDILGREVRTLINSDVVSGTSKVEWNGKNNFGQQVASGMYIYRIEAGSFVSTRKMMLLK